MKNKDFDFQAHGLKEDTLIEETHQGKVKVFRVNKGKDEYALKAITKAWIDSEFKVQQIQNEKAALKELEHPGIVKLVDTYKDDDYICFLEELVYGIPLHKIISAEGKTKADLVKLVGYQLAIILEYMHQKGWIYRDIKLSNVIVSEEGRVILVDFGFAEKIDDKKSTIKCGTVHAMAPEMFGGDDKGYSFEIDHYSFGILVYELLLGSPPFGFEDPSNPQEIQDKIKKGITETELSKVEDEKLRDLIAKLLDKDPSQRLGSKNGFTEILQHPFFEKLKKDEVIDYMKGHDFTKVSFSSLIARCELYLELVWFNGIKKKSVYDYNNSSSNSKDPFAGF